MAMTLEELLALFPDNTSGEIKAVDLRTLVTEFWGHHDAQDVRVSALEAAEASGGGTQFSVTGVWQVNPQPGVTPQGAQVASDTGSMGTATILKFAGHDKNDQDAISVLMASSAIFAQQKLNSQNWVSYNVRGAPSYSNNVVTVPVTVLKSSGTTGAVAWQDASIVINVTTTA